MARKPPKSLANPTLLKPIDKQDGMLQVIIETPKGQPEQIRLRRQAKCLRREEGAAGRDGFPV